MQNHPGGSKLVLAKTMLWVDFRLQTMFYQKCQFRHSEESFHQTTNASNSDVFIIWFFNISMTLVFWPERNIIFVSCCDSCCSTFFFHSICRGILTVILIKCACNGSRNGIPTFYSTTRHLCIWHLCCLASNVCNLSTSMMLVSL